MVLVPQVIADDSSQAVLAEKLRPDKLYVGLGGGIGRFGANFTALHCNEQTLWIDAGMGFANQFTRGMSKSLPNRKIISALQPNVIIFSHGHEDHIGALPHLYECIQERTLIIGSEFTLQLLQNRLREHSYAIGKFQWKPIKENGSIVVTQFQLSFFFMPHSIPEAFSIGIECTSAKVKAYFTSDFKTKGHEPRFSQADIENFGPVDFLFCDSTGSLSNGFTPSEKDVIENLEEVIAGWPGRIFITTFASHIERISAIFVIAKKFNRPVAIKGASMMHQLSAAYSVGQFSQDVTRLAKLSTRVDDAIWLISGCQADVNSSFSRLCHKDNFSFQLGKKDMLIYASSVIPGNEEQVYSGLNALSGKGMKIRGIFEKQTFLHASGHGKREDIVSLLSWLKPYNVIPVHGDSLHFNRFHDIADELDFQVEVFDVRNGSFYVLENRVKLIHTFEESLQFVEDKEIHNDKNLYRLRGDLATDGLCNVIVREADRTLVDVQYIATLPKDTSLNILALKDEISTLVKSVPSSRRLHEKIYKINRQTLGKKPFVNVIMV